MKLISEGHMIRLLFTLFIVVMALGCTKSHPPTNSSIEEKASEILTLLNEKKYTELEKTLLTYQAAFERGEISEDDIFRVFYTFNRRPTDFEKHLREWAEASPDSYLPRLAKGQYYSVVGWAKRGDKFAKNTSPAQFQEMESNHRETVAELNIALDKNPKLIVAYTFLLDVHRAMGERALAKETIEKGLRYFPNSLLLRWFYLLSLEPKWGGSIEEMKNFIKLAEPYYASNPELKVLDGRVFAVLGDQMVDKQNYPEALNFLNQAIARGGNHYYYNRIRGIIYFRLKEYHKAISDLDISLSQRPSSLQSLYYRAYCYLKLGMYQQAIADFDRVLKIDPDYEEAAKNRLWCQNKL